MAGMPKERIADLLHPFLDGYPHPATLFTSLQTYLDLLLRWNEKTNLTAIRDPEEMVTRHFGESLFAGVCVARRAGESGEALDLGSGAGFPGIPIALLLSDWRLVLAESQGKKSAFLREAVRVLGLSTEVWAARAETMPVARTFDVVALRAVDNMGAMLTVGRERVRPGGWLCQLSGAFEAHTEQIAVPPGVGRVLGITRI